MAQGFTGKVALVAAAGIDVDAAFLQVGRA